VSSPSTIRVLAALLQRDGRWLIGQRPAHKRHGGHWEFPGGKVEPGETDAEAMARELREELGLELVSLGTERCVVHDAGSPFEIAFVEVEARGVPVAHEHSALAWVSAHQFGSYALAPSDVICAGVLAAGSEPHVPPGDAAGSVASERHPRVLLTHLAAGEQVIVLSPFRTFDGDVIEAGRTLTFAAYDFFPYDEGYTIRCEETAFRLSGLFAEQAAVLANADGRFFGRVGG
jgi:mutator protein MutT